MFILPRKLWAAISYQNELNWRPTNCSNFQIFIEFILFPIEHVYVGHPHIDTYFSSILFHYVLRRDLMTQEVNTLHLFTAGGYRHLLKRPSTLLMRAQRQLILTLAGPILELGEPTPACVIAVKTADSSKHFPLHCHIRCPQLISRHLAAEILVTSIGCLPGRNADSTLPKAPRGFQILVACP